MTFDILSKRPALESPHFSVDCETVRLPNGKVDDFYIERARDRVAIFCLTTDQRVLLIKEYRHGCREYILNIPMGQIEAGQTPLESAIRELREETGYAAEYYTLVQTTFSNPVRSASRCHLFVATNAVVAGPQEQTDFEEITALLMPFGDLLPALARGDFIALPTQALVYRALHFLGHLPAKA